MDKGIKFAFLLILLSTELLFIVFAILAILKTYSYKKIEIPNYKKLKSTTLFFLFFAILSEISYGFFSFLSVGKIIYILFLLFELYFINFIQRMFLPSKIGNRIFSISLYSVSPLFIGLFFIKWDITLLNSALAIESFIVGCISLNFFINLKNQITNNHLLNQQGTLLMIGLFFCYTIPLPFNTIISILSIFEQNISNKENSHYLIYFSLSRLGTICYIFFFYFIRKAFQ